MPESTEALHIERDQLLAAAQRETRIAENTPDPFSELAEAHFMAAGCLAQQAEELQARLDD